MSPLADHSQKIDLNTPLQFLKGCGPRRAELLARLEQHTVRDLLFFFPRDYHDLTDLRTIDQLEEGPLVSVLGMVEEVELSQRDTGRSMLGVLIRSGNDYLRAVWFNQPFLRDKYRRGQTLLLSGKARRRGLRWEMAHPHVRVVELEEPSPLVGEGGEARRREALADEPGEGAAPPIESTHECEREGAGPPIDFETAPPHPHPGPLPSRERDKQRTDMRVVDLEEPSPLVGEGGEARRREALADEPGEGAAPPIESTHECEREAAGPPIDFETALPHRHPPRERGEERSDMRAVDLDAPSPLVGEGGEARRREALADEPGEGAAPPIESTHECEREAAGPPIDFETALPHRHPPRERGEERSDMRAVDLDAPSPLVGEGGEARRREALADEPGEGAAPVERLSPPRHPHPGPLPSSEREVRTALARDDEAESMPLSGLLPIYPLTEGLQQHQVRRLVRRVLDVGLDALDEVFPVAYLEGHELLPLRTALPELHFPTSRQTLEQARRRFVYQELLVLQLALALKREQARSAVPALPLQPTAKIDARIRRLFPFEFTSGQNQAAAEIAADLARSQPMNRLLQGDVGSGKTVVAVYAMLLAVAQQAQVVLMAPTEVLARQHFDTLSRLLVASQARLGLLTGAQTGKARAELLEQIASGQTQIVIGTQAAATTELSFARLGLVIIDEQHKFGVRQRAALRSSGFSPHYLVMTATPIPRTLGMTFFGDLDVTTLRDHPPGRQQVHSYLPPAEDRPRWWDFFRKKLREGRQGYVIVPLVEGSRQVQAANLEESYEALANGELEAFRLGLVHGGMTPSEKHAAMEAFREGTTQALLATSVVEVGIDVPNATLMTIEGAERFGLAQLHQLRGRVSRGRFPGYCTLFANAQTPEAQARLEAFIGTTDGFELAEIDFKLRGPGDLVGTRQHGLPPLRIADMLRDAATVEEARRDARALVEADPGLNKPEYALLRRMALVRYGKSLDLADVG